MAQTLAVVFFWYVLLDTSLKEAEKQSASILPSHWQIVKSSHNSPTPVLQRTLPYRGASGTRMPAIALRVETSHLAKQWEHTLPLIFSSV